MAAHAYRSPKLLLPMQYKVYEVQELEGYMSNPSLTCFDLSQILPTRILGTPRM